MTERIEFAGIEIPFKLAWGLKLPEGERPITIIKTSDPRWPGGMTYEGYNVDSTVTSIGDDGKISLITPSLSHRGRIIEFPPIGWYPPGVAPQGERVIETIMFFGKPGYRLDPDHLEFLINSIPNITSSDIAWARLVNERLSLRA